MEDNNFLRLNIGCGPKQYNGYINIDINEKDNPDLVRNVERGLPFSDNTVEHIITEHYLEHVDPDLIHFVMFEIWRVLKPGGIVNIVVPIGNGWSNSPEHKTPFNEHTDIFFTKWNDKKSTGYDFKLSDKKVIRASVPDLGENSEGYGDELRIALEVVK